MALLTNNVIDADGIVVTLAQAANCTVDCSNGKTFLEVNNADASPINVTITTPGTDADGNAIADRVVAVANATRQKIFLNPAVYGSIAAVAFSATTDITCAAYTS